MTQEMYDKAVDFYLLTLKLDPYWFVTRKMIERLDNAIFSNADLVLNSINLNNINLDDDNFDDCNPETINHVRRLAWYKDISNTKHIKKMDQELMSVAWHPTKAWD